jgi:16S rRNA processing protein RimM
VGKIVAVENFGAGDIIEVEQSDGRRVMVPVRAAEIGESVTIPADYV